MNQYYLRLLVDHGFTRLDVQSKRINFDYEHAVYLARASGLKSKKRRKVVKRFKRELMRILRNVV